MNAAVTSIIGSLALVSGFLGLLWVLAMTRKSRLELDRRIGLVSAESAPKAMGRSAFSAFGERVASLNSRLRAVFMLGMPRTWGVTTSVSILIAVGVIAGCMGWLLVRFGFHLSIYISALSALAAAALAPRALVQRQQNQAEQHFLELFPDAIEMAVRMLRAGLPIAFAIRAVATDSLPPISTEFKRLNNQLEIGVAVEKALAIEGARINLPDFSYFVVAVALQQATGGNLAHSLSILAEIMRQRRTLRLKVRSATAEVRMTAAILGALPFVTIGALLLTSPSYLTPLFFDPRGNFILGASACSLMLAFLSMGRLVRGVTSMA
jgi:tight adherence protein B